jgi:hypothetical protein
MFRARKWAFAGTASFAGVLVLAWVADLEWTGGPPCAAHQKTDLAMLERAVLPVLPTADRRLVIATTGCASGDPAALSWDTTRPAAETFTSLTRAGWTRLPNPATRQVTDGYYRIVGKGYVTITYLAVNSAFEASTVAP